MDVYAITKIQGETLLADDSRQDILVNCVSNKQVNNCSADLTLTTKMGVCTITKIQEAMLADS